jgi:hypothetical protein
MREDTLRDDRFEVSVTFDERRGYVASAPELRSPVTALSLGGLRRRIEVPAAARRCRRGARPIELRTAED